MNNQQKVMESKEYLTTTSLSQIDQLNSIIYTLEEENKLLKDENTKLKTQLNAYQDEVKSPQNSQFSSNSLRYEVEIKTPDQRRTRSRRMTQLMDFNQDLMDNTDQNNDLGQRLFQNFFIIGPDENELKNSDQKVMIVKPKIISSYPFNQMEKQYYIKFKVSRELAPHIFPDGVKARKIIIKKAKLEQKISQIYMTILQTSSSQKTENEFIFTMKEPQDYKVQNNLNPLLEQANPNLFKYCICFQFNDFYTNNKKDEQDVEVWMCPVVYCFMTYYPFISFFQDMNAQIRNMLKATRCSEISLDNTQTKIFDVDLIYSITVLNRSQEITQLLSELYMQVPKLNQKYIFKSNIQSAQLLSLRNLTFQDASFLEIEWCADITFNQFSANQFWYIFTALILEQHVTLLSSNQCLLSATMLTFINLLRPFKYAFHSCFTIPREFLGALEASMPFFFGIKGNYQEYKEDLSNIMNDDMIYIDIDTKQIFYSAKQTYNDLYDFIPEMPQVVLDYKKINPSQEVGFQSYAQTSKTSISSSPPLYKNYSGSQRSKQIPLNTIDIELYRNVFRGFQDFMNHQIIKHIPNEPFFIPKQHPDVSSIVERMKLKRKLSNFAKKFLDTQTFSLYVDDNYDQIINL